MRGKFILRHPQILWKKMWIRNSNREEILSNPLLSSGQEFC